MAALPAAELNSYYRCVHEVDPHVSPGLSGKEYMKLLDNRPHDDRLALGDAEQDARPSLVDGGIPIHNDTATRSELLDLVMTSYDNDATPPLQEQGELVGPGLLADGPVEPEPHVAPVDSEPRPIEDEISELTPMTDFGPPPLAVMKFGPTIEGVPIQEGIYWDGCRSYSRWTVVCPLSKCRHKVRGSGPCKKYRNTGPNQTSVHGIGEVYAFLGLWLRKHRDVTKDRFGHVNYKPIADEIKQYVEENGLQGLPPS